jgi:putative spermidine/putrescine transport system substrate-binding protein
VRSGRRSARFQPGDSCGAWRRFGQWRQSGGKEAGEKGLAYFAEMNKAGNFVPVIGKAGTVAQGATPIVVAWDYNALSWRDTLAMATRRLKLSFRPMAFWPASTCRRSAPMRRIRTQQSSGWSISIPTKVSLAWLKGYCHPIRFNDLVKNGKVPQELLDKLPPAESYDKAYFPTLEEVNDNKAAVTAGWDSVVGANVQ